MPGAPPARPAPPRSLAEERPRGPPRPARGVLPTGTLGSPASSRPRTCRPPPSAPPPRASRSPGACGRRAARVSPRPAPARRPARPRVCPPFLLSLPPRFLLSPPSRRTSGSQIPPLSRLSAGPLRFVEVTWWLRNPGGNAKPPLQEATLGRLGGSERRSVACGVFRLLSGNSG